MGSKNEEKPEPVNMASKPPKFKKRYSNKENENVVNKERSLTPERGGMMKPRYTRRPMTAKTTAPKFSSTYGAKKVVTKSRVNTGKFRPSTATTRPGTGNFKPKA